MQRAPFPVPTGWYFVDFSENLQPGELRNIQQFGQEWVFFRTESGKPAVSDPYCPHLGAHLGHGGKVCGEHLRCPFHHWEYDADGMCKVIPYATVVPPITQRGPVLRTLPTVEKYGMVWSWYHPRCEPPAWELPHIPELEEPGFACTRRGSWAADTCIQEIAENGVDFAHLRFLARRAANSSRGRQLRTAHLQIQHRPRLHRQRQLWPWPQRRPLHARQCHIDNDLVHRSGHAREKYR